MNKKQWAILAVVSGLLVCTLFIIFFKDRLDKIVVILIGAALGMTVAEVIRFFGRRL
jgi:Na+/melibiose symporter-like transporter